MALNSAFKKLRSSPITSWQTDEEKVETETDFIFLDSKITADSDCSHEIKRRKTKQNKTKKNNKRRLLLERKAMTNLDSELKTRDTTLPTKV